MRKATYASKTTVPIHRSQDEIRTILNRYGATAFAVVERKESASMMFELEKRAIRFTMTLPAPPSANATVKAKKEHEQLIKSLWRSLTLAIKAKLECVAAGITTLEQEFLAHIVLQNGSTFGDYAIPQIAQAYEKKGMPQLLGMGE